LKTTIHAETPQKESKMNIPFFPDRIVRFSDARAFFNWLRSEGVLYTPNDPFEEYDDLSGQPSFTSEQVKLLNRLMREAYAVLGDDYPQPNRAEIRHSNRLETKVIKEMQSDPVKFKNRVLDLLIHSKNRPSILNSRQQQGQPWTEDQVVIIVARGWFCDPELPSYDVGFDQMLNLLGNLETN
jgi:hypothetical protein